MSCKYGSEKREQAPDSFSTNDIGVICELFEMEGSLCRLLDLVPDAIQRIFSFNFVDDNHLDLWEELLKKAAKKTGELIFDELTGRVNINSFCAADPPRQLEPVNYSDVFIFLAELVPILNYFFLANEVLTGDSTKLLDKIVNQFTRKKWFQYCECKPKPKQPEEVPSKVNPPVTSNCMSADDLEYLNSIVDFWNEGMQGSALAAEISNQLNSASNVDANIDEYVQTLTNQGRFNIRVESLGDDILAPVNPPYETSVGRPTGSLTLTFNDYRIDTIYRKVVKADAFDFFGNVISDADIQGFNGQFHHPYEVTTNLVENCPQPDPPPPFDEEEEGNKKKKDDFCALFPDDPDCSPSDDDGSECETEYVICAESYCGEFRKPIRLVLNVTGEPQDITCEEFTACDEARTEETRVLLDCVAVEPPPPTCEDSEAVVRDWALNFAMTGEIYVGYWRPVTLDDLSYALSQFNNSEFYDGNCESQFHQWITEVWQTYFEISGCTDPNALNYNPDATVDDGSCEY